MKKKLSTRLAWGLCVGVVISILASIATSLRAVPAAARGMALADNLSFSLFLILSAVVGALIISRQPRNTIGWLLMIYPLGLSLTGILEANLSGYTPGDPPTTPEFLAAWATGWGWWLLIGPILMIPLLFPTGRLPSQRWRWVLYLLAAAFATFLVVATIGPVLTIREQDIPNPIGVMSAELAAALVLIMQILLGAAAIASVSALFRRYRRATDVEREQIRWLWYAFGIFLVVFLVGLFLAGENDYYGLFLNLAFMTIPLAIGAAILRYRLWDIDLIINRTLVYVPLTALVAGFYSLFMALSQRFITATTGQKSDAAVLATTFLLVTTFTPIKNWIQQQVDKRFKEPSTTLKEVNAFEAQVRSVMEVLDGSHITRRLLTTSVEAVNASGGAVYLDRGADLRLEHATPGWQDTEGKLSLPLTWNGMRIGLLCLGARKTAAAYTPAEQKALQQAADRVAWALAGALKMDEVG